MEIETAFGGGRDLQAHVRRRRKDRSGVWVTIAVTPVRDHDGRTVQHFASFADISRDKDREGRLLAPVDDLESRSQATLAAVRALAAQTLRDIAGQDAANDFERRALARISPT